VSLPTHLREIPGLLECLRRGRTHARRAAAAPSGGAGVFPSIRRVACAPGVCVAAAGGAQAAGGDAVKFIPTITEPVYPPEGTRRTGHGFVWTPRELQVIRERYLSEGLNACLALLPVRCKQSVMNQAAKMGLRRQKPHSAPKQSNEMLDAALKRLYAEPLKRGALRDFANRWGVSRQWAYWRAKALGLTQSLHPQQVWTPEEDALIEEHAHQHPAVISRKLRKAGFDRTPGAVLNRRVRLSCYAPDPDVFTANGLATCMGLDSHRVIDFIRRHGLKAQKNGDDQRDPWRIKRADLRRWLIESAVWDHKRCNREWLIEMLAGRIGKTDSERERVA